MTADCCRRYELRLFMLSLTRTQQYYQVFLSQAIGMGIGMGLVVVPAVSLPSQYFRRRRMLVMGLVYAGQAWFILPTWHGPWTPITGSSLGGVIFPIMLNHLINSSLGFAWSVRYGVPPMFLNKLWIFSEPWRLWSWASWSLPISSPDQIIHRKLHLLFTNNRRLSSPFFQTYPTW